MTGRDRYWQAMTKARIQAARSLRRWMEGKEAFVECRMDLERDALIKEFERLGEKAEKPGPAVPCDPRLAKNGTR